MTFPTLSPERRPLDGSSATIAPQALLGKPRDARAFVPVTRTKNADSIAKGGPAAKPWAHFVAGG